MTMPLAVVRPDDWNFPLLLHVLGAMLLVGTLVTVVSVLAVAWGGSGRSLLPRVGFRTLLFATIPSWLLMRLAGEWIRSKENYGGDDDPTWLGIGYITAEPGLVILIVATVLAGLAARQAARHSDRPSVLARIATVLAALLLTAYLVAMWAMTTKPG
jgi:hypothetical protein